MSYISSPISFDSILRYKTSLQPRQLLTCRIGCDSVILGRSNESQSPVLVTISHCDSMTGMMTGTIETRF